MKYLLINFCFFIVIIHNCYGYGNSTKFNGTIENTNKNLTLHYGDLLKCKVYATSKNNQNNGNVTGLKLIQKKSILEAIYFPLSQNQKCFTFWARTNIWEERIKETHIHFTNKNNGMIFKAELDKYNNTLNEYYSVLLDRYNNELKRNNHVNSILKNYNYEKIWANITSTRLEVGINATSILSHSDKYEERVTQIGVASGSQEIEYVIPQEHKCGNASVIQTAKIYCEEFKNNNSTNNNATENNLILIQKDIYQQIYSDYRTFSITIEGTGNSTGNSTTNLYAKRHLYELDQLFLEAKHNHNRIMHSNDKKEIAKYLIDSIYVQIKWQYFNYLKSVLERVG